MPEKPKEKKYYTVEVECLIPAIVRYRVLVEDGDYEKAVLETTKALPIQSPTLKMNKMKRLVSKVYDWGTHMLRYQKRG